MLERAKKFYDAVNLPYTLGTAVFVICALIADKDRVLDFFETTFKSQVLFVVFLICSVLLSISMLIRLKKTQKYLKNDREIKNNKIENFNIGLIIVRGLLTGGLIILLFLLIRNQYKVVDYGMLGGTEEGNSDFFSLLNKNINSNKPNTFAIEKTSRLNYSDADEKIRHLFHRFYRNGVAYSVRYNNDPQSRIIFLNVQWIGEKLSCITDKEKQTFTGAFDTCTVGIVKDAGMVSNFIIGFTRFHLCDTSADTYFRMVQTQINNLPVEIKSRMQDLIDKTNEFLGDSINNTLVSIPQKQPSDTSLNKPKVDSNLVWNFLDRKVLEKDKVYYWVKGMDIPFDPPFHILKKNSLVIVLKGTEKNVFSIFRSDSTSKHFSSATGENEKKQGDTTTIKISSTRNFEVGRIKSITPYISEKRQNGFQYYYVGK